MNESSFCNNYPTVFVHGFLGNGDEPLLHKVYRDFGVFSMDMPKEMNRRGFETFQPGVGPLNSIWDRCCILWAYLVGGTVDFGKVHSEKNHHARYGRTYPGVLKDWGQEGAHKKINLLGHSFGGPTVCLFATLLEAGSAEERAGTPEDELSDLFKGGKGHLVHTVTTLSGANNGTSATDLLGVKGRHFAGYLLYGLFMTFSETRGARIFDMMNEHFGLMKDPYTNKDYHFTNPWKRKEELKNLVCGDDEVFWQLSVERNRQQVKDYVMVPGAYYFARRVRMTEDNGKGHQKPLKGITPAFRLTVPLMERYRNPALGIDDSWAPSDGIVSVRGTEAPAGMPCRPYDPAAVPEPGIWYVAEPTLGKDHQSYIGMAMEKDEYYTYFNDLLTLFRTLPDA